MNLIDAQCLEILHKWKKGQITREEAQEEIDKHGDKIRVHLYQDGFTVEHLNNFTT